jgi:translation initiation factor 3 subunit E
VGQYLDRHLVFPLLEFLQVQGVYPEPEILQAKIDMLQQTNMVDFAMDIHASLHGADAPCQGTRARRAAPPPRRRAAG